MWVAIKVILDLKGLLKKREVLGLSVIFGELLQGAKDENELQTINGFWQNLPKMEEGGLFIEGGLLSNRYRLFSKGVDLIDSFVLAAAIRENSEIWTLDKKLVKVIQEIDF